MSRRLAEEEGGSGCGVVEIRFLLWGREKQEKNSTDVTRSLFILFFFEVDLCECDVHTPGGSARLVHLCRQLKRSLPGWTLSCV